MGKEWEVARTEEWEVSSSGVAAEPCWAPLACPQPGQRFLRSAQVCIHVYTNKIALFTMCVNTAPAADCAPPWNTRPKHGKARP
jgi:hypothetical protein